MKTSNFFLLLSICTFFHSVLGADRVWQQVIYSGGAVPSPRAYHVMAAYGNFIYVYGGLQEESNTPNNIFHELWKYDTVANIWSNVTITADTAAGVDPLAGASSTVVGNYWFIFGGNSPGTPLSISGNFYSFDFTTEIFHQYFSLSNDPPGFQLAGGCMTSLGNQWFTFGGTSTGPIYGIVPTCTGSQIYGPDNNPSFVDTDISTVPVDPDNPNGSPPTTYGHVCFSYQNTILVFFAACQLSDAALYPVLSTTVGNINNFINVTSVNAPVNAYRNFVSAVSNNGVSVFFGGWSIINLNSGTNATVAYFNDTQIFTAATNTWESVNSFGPSGRKSAGGARIGNTFYIFGGVGANPASPQLRYTQNDMWSISVSEIANSSGVTNTVSLFTILIALVLFLFA